MADINFGGRNNIPDIVTSVILSSIEDPSLNVIFELNPQHVRRSYSSTYSQVPIALSRHVAEEWKYNNPVEIAVDFILSATGKDNVEDDLESLEAMRDKYEKTRQPHRLSFQMGPRVELVQMHRLEIDPVFWTPDLRIQQARVNLTLHTIELRKLRTYGT